VDDVAVAICKDLDFQDAALDNAGARALLVPAWDFDVDAELHRRMAILRGVEGGFAVVRAARNGYVSVHDAGGHLLGEARSSAPVTVLVVDVPLADRATWFARLGVAIGPALGALALALGALALVLQRRAP